MAESASRSPDRTREQDGDTTQRPSSERSQPSAVFPLNSVVATSQRPGSDELRWHVRNEMPGYHDSKIAKLPALSDKRSCSPNAMRMSVVVVRVAKRGEPISRDCRPAARVKSLTLLGLGGAVALRRNCDRCCNRAERRHANVLLDDAAHRLVLVPQTLARSHVGGCSSLCWRSWRTWRTRQLHHRARSGDPVSRSRTPLPWAACEKRRTLRSTSRRFSRLARDGPNHL
jgi:hypothetical protein